MSRRQIPFPFAAAALEMVENGYSRQDAENATGVDEVTISDIQKKKGHWLQDVEKPIFEEWRRRTKREIQGRANELAVKLLAHADKCVTKSPEKTSPYQAVGMYGILRTHDRLDAGESTENISIRGTVEIQATDALAAVLAQALLDSPKKESESA